MTLVPPGPALDAVVTSTRTWIERAVIGLNLCPFARAAYTTNRIRYAVSDAAAAEPLREDLVVELRLLSQTAPTAVETTLLIHPAACLAFADHNAFLDIAGAALQALDLVGVLQIASFHPAYQFAGTTLDDITNYTNRAPYPTLHLLREASLDVALATFPDAASIYLRNIATMRRLGATGWETLVSTNPLGPRTDSGSSLNTDRQE